ncbi:response regulator transcription factor [Nocardioides sp. JQ2195]|uniref:helix-turn-helix transcriptional regulator n=1 Tax=Nocardioides sp. JQ2195 TaxID=2592334 RepID=UPI00143EF076|nr:response regulator transcription factor [Nocardioides sp. JQ2195]QIX25413.1 response regulator transcription factor [Nocardioides sp. JQ2195]
MPLRRLDALAVLGISPSEVDWHQRLRPHSGVSLDEAAAALEIDREELERVLEPLVAAGVAAVSDDQLSVPAGYDLLAEVVAAEADQLRSVVDRLERLRVSIPDVSGMLGDQPAGPGLSDVELRAGHDVHATLRAWVSESRGDLMWLRPDQWKLPQEPAMSRAVRAALARGQRSRAIYPARVLEEAPRSLFERMDAGEEVRLVPEVPSRMAVVAGVGAVVPEVWGVANQRRILLRQVGMTAVLAELFEEIWSRAVVVPGAARGDTDRRMLLQQMGRGMRDEQIARTMGLSLRTVRRRVADLLQELGVDTRFQAGVEAVRRGWV